MRNIYTGKITPDGTAVYVEVGFIPSSIRIVTDGPVECQTLAVGHDGGDVVSVKRDAAGAGSFITAVEQFGGGEIPEGSKVIRKDGLPLLASPNDLQNLTDGDTIEVVPADENYNASAGFMLGVDADLNVNGAELYFIAEAGSES